MKYFFYILIFLIYSKGICQEYADKNYYLVDSLDLSQLTDSDKKLVDDALILYYSANADTSRIIALDDICGNMMHKDWSKYQLLQYQIIENALSNTPSRAVKSRLLKSKSAALNNMGMIYNDEGNISKAIDFHHQSLKIKEDIGDSSGIANSLNNIGIIYSNQIKFPMAISYFEKSLSIQEKISDKRGVAGSLNNIGTIYKKQGELDLALEFFEKSMKVQKDIGYTYGVAYSLNNIGYIYNEKEESDTALKYFHLSLKMLEEIGDKSGIANSLHNIGDIELSKGNVNSALTNALQSFEIAKENGFPDDIKSSAELLSRIYEKQNKGMKALAMHRLYSLMKDSINNKATQQATAQQQAKYEYEKQKALDDAFHKQQQAIDNAEYEKVLALEQEEKETQKVIIYAICAGLGLVVIFLLFVFNRLQVTKKQKLIIEDQKKQVESQKNVVEVAHHKLEEKNQEILDSINYAKRIQSAILPPSKLVKEYLQDSFILYKPKDIVAGDFYWMEHKDGKVLFAAADCTGHGVPGAMVSVICNNGLNRSVREHNLTDPGQILDKTREIVIQEFEKSDEEVKDGMDIALCSLEFMVPNSLLTKDEVTEEKLETHFDSISTSLNTGAQRDKEHRTVAKLQYAGANNPLWIIRDGEIIETKADKQPIGKFDKQTPYTTHTFQLEKGDSIYIFSDGFVDQFGGKRGKKFKAKAFRELLLSIQVESMEKQKGLIDNVFENWRGDLEQIDDVCVIGVRV